jgi:hypothetical protein
LMVEGDGGCEAAEACEDSFSESGQGACAVAFEGEQVFAGPEDALDALTDRGEVRPVAGFVFAARTDERRVALADLDGELASCVTLVAQEGLATVASDAVQQHQANVAFVDLRRDELERSGVPSGAKIACKRNPQKKRECERQYP